MANNNNEEKEYVTLEFEDEDGNMEEIEYTVENFVDVGDQSYIVLVQTEQEDAIEFYRFDEIGDEAELNPIEDEDEFKAVISKLRETGYDIKIES
ncbi:MAG: DUF1292 domain-containing protein [Eubacteriaceae bacterium]|nr:DUF1292 domain-containing protein [Eubacteriaceae bacterium]